MRVMRSRLAAALLTLVLALLLSASVADAPAPGIAGASVVRSGGVAAASAPTAAESSKNGADAVASLGPRLPAVARRNGWTAERLTNTLVTDPTLRVDSTDHLFYVEPVVKSDASSPSSAAATAAPQAAAPYPMSQTFTLHSLPGARLTILLDFGPRTMSGNAWTDFENGGSDIPCPAWSLDSDPAFSDTEKAAIQEVWQRVAEDYAPFKVDVTTQFTSEAAITRSSSSDSVYGTRVLVSPISSYIGAYGGIAYVGVFNDSGDYYKPALVFPERLGNSAKNIAEAASHECGHNLGLSHDGTPSQSYYQGSGSGETGWAPIMGASYSRNLTQWSRGEYPSANDPEDDVAIVQGYLGYQADDAGDTPAAAVVLPTAATLSAAGLVSSASDVDVYRFNAGDGAATIDVKPAAVGPDLDVLAEIRDAGGNVVTSSNASDLLSAHLATTLQQGTYYLFVRGTGKGSPQDSGGYSSYASIGRYAVSGTVPDATPVIVSGTLSGTVSAGGVPLPGVSVSVPGTAGVTTAANGTYSLAGITPGTYDATFSKTGYTSQTIAVTLTSGNTTTRDVTLTAPIPGILSGTLSGTVSVGGVPRPGVSVSVPGTATVTTAANGTYSVAGITPGTYDATFSKTGYTSQTIAVTITSGNTATRDVTLVVAPTMTPVYRFFNKTNGSHFYTATEAEKNSVLANLSASYSLDGVAYQVSSVYTTPLHRFFNKANGSHFYTASEAEKNSVIANPSATYSYDGVAYNVSAAQVAGSTPVYRFFNKKNGSHFYTASETEKNSVIANLSATYALDGAAFYVAP